ncbi:glycerol-3-phosphate dehydrogenase/oxidase [Flavobacterium columnare NBRC 100251 = ATCC 23463]|uniref:FAD dependent oxidoreductase n=2 Tax=Flavobacterium columnare TaxID=996 RepID=G8X7C1_FLACA|nr:glycerol-3-phosphate dehydrogenase/oxidase [Flavobacterium columnare]AEW84935.1 FAD dependent oxidoreductase [Flavobacterium columnare ATCC 49512]AMO19282.1 glycerol-3-phosphate dehydrogenase/oxidase [Flavobacterium columnare]ANO48207.1 FAD dependent oxidoreductase [Flavobacterium columnare]APT21229.1 FAD-dependent oxidoreductase [Flavobacterium columnare]AUX17219.1 FAD-dependent oxidoreductase [Flavobacterium columnare]
MNRQDQIQKLKSTNDFDIIIIGGGATGLGCAVDSASRGYKTLLIEKNDFAKGTSSRATKLVHGGVRYLAQGNIRLVREALLERGRLLNNAPHVCKKVSFVMPAYHWYDKWFYGIGLWIYELLSSKLSLGTTQFLSKKQTKEFLPDLDSKDLFGGVLYYDGQFDDSRLAINLAQTAIEQEAIIVNYFEVIDFIKEENCLKGVKIKDVLTQEEYYFKSKVVINATGVFADDLLSLAENTNSKTIAPSQGIHLVIDSCFFKGHHALMMPKTDDGRVFFIIPWYDKIILGTTDTAVSQVVAEPLALEEEIQFVLNHFNKYSLNKITRKEVKSVFVGLRPLVKKDDVTATKVMPRDHVITVLPSGLIHIIGGKWTTYRSMAEHTINVAIQTANLPFKKCRTKSLKIHGWTHLKDSTHLSIYGADGPKIKELLQKNSGLAARLHPKYPYTKAEVVWFLRNEMAQTVEDVLARRIRLLFLDAFACLECVEVVAEIIATEKGITIENMQKEIQEFKQLTKQYLTK